VRDKNSLKNKEVIELMSSKLELSLLKKQYTY